MLQMLALIVAGLAMAVLSLAQDRSGSLTPADKYMISAKAGGVNYVEGDVTVIRPKGRTGPLLRRDELEIGDRVTTGANGKAEICLNPGSFLRVASNSTFEFRSTSLDDLQIVLASGSAMFEVFADNKFTVSVFTPKENLTFVETGVYRIDLEPNGRGTVAVVEGKAEVGDYPATIVKKGQTTEIGTGNTTVAKFDRGKRDELAEWSRTRGKDLAKVSNSLRGAGLTNALTGTYRSGRWNLYGSFGLWVFDPFSGGYCFLPFGRGWNSPYGYGYGNGIDWYNLPPVVQPPRDTTIIAAAPGTETPRDPITRPKPFADNARSGPPPFTQLDRKSGGGDYRGGREYDSSPGNQSRDSYGSGSIGMPRSGPVSSPPVMSSAPVETPAPQKTIDKSPVIDH